MGQGQSTGTSSNNPNISDVYSSYIGQQQRLIQLQQQQINSLYKMNLDQSTSQQMPANIAFQQQQQQQPNPNLQALPSTKINPYKVLGISKQYDMTSLKKAYLKKAMKAHPDRGGSKHEFQRISIAYTLLQKKLKEEGDIHHHHELRDGSKSYMGSQNGPGSQGGQGGQPINFDKDHFDAEVFNKIYEENRMEDAFDGGYGSWMKESDAIESSQPQQKMFQGNFNKDLFNHEFAKYKQEQSKKQGSQVVQYQEPQERLSMKNQDSLVTLGQGRVSNFSGEAGNLGFTDYKAAFTTDSTLIDTSTVSIDGRAHSIKGVERERSNVSYTLSSEDQQKIAYQEAMKQKEERARVQRLQVYDQKGEDMYSKVHQLLLR
jgi:curved DNA-binding protein CbpA